MKEITQPLIGRKKEQETLLALLHSPEPEMVAIVGRRRVGKTFLIRTVYENRIDFELTGIQNATQEKQLQHFHTQLKIQFGRKAPKKLPTDWMDAFWQLISILDKLKKTEKAVIFLDELSWLATPKSGFLEALGFFWNSWASKRNIVVVICGSAASWMIQKVIYDKGGLHNRITKRIDLQPFTLYETELYLKSRKVSADRYQILQLYMAMGGIPHYLKEVAAGKSAIQNIDAMCFSQGGLLNDEFSKLYPALFEHADNHIAIVRALSQKWKGMSRVEIVASTKLPDGGGLTNTIEELVSCGFVSAYYPFGKKKKDMLYRLTDEYSLFYLHFIENQRIQEDNIWQHLSQTQTWKSWSGYAFESICLKHLGQLKKALGISGIYAEASSYFHKGTQTEQGIQIDLVLDRKDHTINLFEMKFYTDKWRLNKSEATELREKVNLFKLLSKTKKQVFLTLVTTFGIKTNEYSLGLIDNDIDMDVLFEP
ncbi:MAG: hypothetical protein RIR11_4752 [Bacteroidota bacterium]